MNLDVRLRRLERLVRMKERLIRVSGSLEAAQQDPRWNDIELLITTLTARISLSIDQPNVNQPLTAGEIAFINLLISQLREL